MACNAFTPHVLQQTFTQRPKHMPITARDKERMSLICCRLLMGPALEQQQHHPPPGTAPSSITCSFDTTCPSLRDFCAKLMTVLGASRPENCRTITIKGQCTRIEAAPCNWPNSNAATCVSARGAAAVLMASLSCVGHQHHCCAFALILHLWVFQAHSKCCTCMAPGCSSCKSCTQTQTYRCCCYCCCCLQMPCQ